MRSVFTLPADLEQLLRMPVYPGMIESESRPLRAWIRRYAVNYHELRFDVRVGPGDDSGGAKHAETDKAWAHLTRMRLDALAWKAPNIATLIECKDVLANDAVWQLLTYRDYYLKEHPHDVVSLVLVASSATIAAIPLAQRYGIGVSLWTFPADTPDIAATGTEATTDGV